MAEIDDLKRKLAARESMPGYEQNVRAIKERIAEIEESAPKDGEPSA
jgi:hypothetical protein